MANEINGQMAWGQVPVWYNDGNYDMSDQQHQYSGGYLLSANEPIIFQLVWTDPSGTMSPSLNEQYVAQNPGDVVNVIFNVLATTEYPIPNNNEFEHIASIRKSKDIPNNNIATGTIPNSQSFTVDISRLIQDQLSYTLVPIGKGSFESQEFGGMNGGPIVQDNIVESVSPYNVTRNGMYRAVRVWCEYEVLDANGALVVSDDIKGNFSIVPRVINSIPNYKDNTYYNTQYILQKWGVADYTQKKALTKCPNEGYDTTAARMPQMKKTVHMDDQAEWLYFYVKESYDGNDITDYYNVYDVIGKT